MPLPKFFGPLLVSFLLLWLSPTTSAITFSLGPVQACGDLVLRWSNSTGPGYLLIAPVNDTPGAARRNISIPANAQSPYVVSSFPEPAGLQFVASLLDSSGYTGSKTSPVQTVQDGGSNACLNTQGAPNNYQQDPAQVVCMIPDGKIWKVGQTNGTQSQSVWNVNAPGGSNVIVTVWGSGGNTTTSFSGSASSINIGQGSTNCIPGGGGSGAGANAGAIAGGVVGGLAVFALLAGFLLYRRRKRHVADPTHPRQHIWKSYKSGRPIELATEKAGSPRSGGTADLLGGEGMSRGGHEPMLSPYMTPSPAAGAGPHSTGGSTNYFAGPGSGPSSSSASNQGQLGHNYQSVGTASPQPSTGRSPIAPSESATESSALGHGYPTMAPAATGGGEKNPIASPVRGRESVDEPMYVEAQDGGRLDLDTGRRVVEMPPRYDRVNP